MEAYTTEDITNAWNAIRAKYSAPEYAIGAAIFNVGHGVWKPFLDVTPNDVQQSLQVVEAAFAFSREAVLAFKGNEISEPTGARGTLIFTGATASLKGNLTTSAFSAGKHALRALSQSLNKEFGKQNIHASLPFPRYAGLTNLFHGAGCPCAFDPTSCSHVTPADLRLSKAIIDGGIVTTILCDESPLTLHTVAILTERHGHLHPEATEKSDVMLNPDSIAKVGLISLPPNYHQNHIISTVIFVPCQPGSGRLDLGARP